MFDFKSSPATGPILFRGQRRRRDRNTMLDETLPLTPPEWPEWGDPNRDAAAFRTRYEGRVQGFVPQERYEGRVQGFVDSPTALEIDGLEAGCIVGFRHDDIWSIE
jgi:hypothetical protein